MWGKSPALHRKELAMATGFLYLLLLSALATSTSSVDTDHLSLVVGEANELQIVPSVLVQDSSGSNPGINIFAERVHIIGLSRMKNLGRFSHALSIKVSHLNSSLHLPNAEVCFHRNLSLGVGMCPRSQWQKLSKGSWSQRMSPFDHKLLDVRMAGSSLGAVKLTLEEEFSAYRIVFLVLGSLFLTLASTFSESLIFYYSSAMVVGIILVMLVILFQGMKLLPTGRGNSLAIVLYSSLVGVGSFLLRYLPRLLHTMLAELGISEDMYNPLATFFVLFISLGGAWLGFWVVRKLVLTEDGSIDTAVSQFVAWSIWILGAVLILQCSLDPLLAAEALISAIVISSILHKAIIRPRLVRRLYRKLRRPGRSGIQKSSDYGSPATDGKHVEHVKDFQYSRFQFNSPPFRRTTPAYSSFRGLSERKSPQPSESETFFSTFHNTPDRRKFSDDEWKAFTRDCTKKRLEELVSSSEFSRWAVAHAERITLAPIEKQPTSRWHRWLSWFR